MSNGIGIDISGFQSEDVPGDWEFVVVKSTENLSVVNPRVDAQWSNAKRVAHRGLYHYARPALSTGLAQGFAFSDDALARGFKPGVDIWQLDCEGQLNEAVSGQDWRKFIDQFMLICKARLGNAGTIYSGIYFFRHDINPERFNWWVPAYGPNDGGVHPLPPDVAQNAVIHQFTSNGGLDRNRIVDAGKYKRMFQSADQPPPKPPAQADVAPRFDPALDKVVDALALPGFGSWLLARDGGVFTDEGSFYGSMVGNPHWGDRKAARLVEPGTVVAGANGPVEGEESYVMVVIAETGERYGLGNRPTK